MAIAPLELDPAYGHTEMPWPRPALRMVVPAGDGWDDEDGDLGWDDEEEDGESTVEWPPPPAAALRVVELPLVREAPSVAPRRHAEEMAARRARRAQVLRRRRVVAVAGLVVTVLVFLALPLRALGASATVAHDPAPRAGEATYTVQPGDTLWSIAERFDAGDPRALVTAMTRETGSSVAVPGERIPVP